MPSDVYKTEVRGVGGMVEVEVHYRIRAWGVDLDEVYIAGTDTKLPMTAEEYFQLTREIRRHLIAKAGLNG